MFALFSNPFGWMLTVIAIIHFIRRRPEMYWLWIIIIGGWIGALVYIAAEVIPDLTLLRGSSNFFARYQRIRRLEELVRQNPSAGNYEELADLYLEDKKYVIARQHYDRAISSRTDSPDPFYRRAICEIQMKDFAPAIEDLKRVVAKDPKYDFLQAQALLAHAYGNTGNVEEADKIFSNVTQTSTNSEALYNYALFLQQQGRPADARTWAQNILDKKPAMPGYLRRRERPWFRKAASLLKQLPK